MGLPQPNPNPVDTTRCENCLQVAIICTGFQSCVCSLVVKGSSTSSSSSSCCISVTLRDRFHDVHNEVKMGKCSLATEVMKEFIRCQQQYIYILPNIHGCYIIIIEVTHTHTHTALHWLNLHQEDKGCNYTHFTVTYFPKQHLHINRRHLECKNGLCLTRPCQCCVLTSCLTNKNKN